ncbi:MAG: pyridoxal phosphate-dependent aminotransferase [Candidatus Bathyarchaeia archaeon]
MFSQRTQKLQRPIYRAIRDYAVGLGIKDGIYLNLGEPDFPTPPHIVEAGKTALNQNFTHYSDDRGFPDLRDAVAENLRQTRRVEVEGGRGVVITDGSTEANMSVLLTLVDAGDEVIVSDPGYPPYTQAIRIAGATPVYAPLDMETLQWDLEQLKSKITSKTKVIIVNSPHNPTGGVYSRELLKAIMDLAQDNDLFVLADETYDAFLYGESFNTITEFDKNLERTVVTNSFSKTFAMTGWRVGYVATSEKLITELVKVKGILNMCSPAFCQKAAISALKGPRDPLLAMLKEYSERRKIVLDSLSHIQVFCPEPKGAFYAFPDISNFSPDSLEFTKFLVREAHVVVSPGIAFGQGGEGHVRISYASSKKDLSMAFERIGKAVEKLPPAKP